MRPRNLGRRTLDLTPLLDVIMILLFGAMIHSVELMKRGAAHDRTGAPGEADQGAGALDRFAGVQEALDESQLELRRLRVELDRARAETAAVQDAMVRVLGLGRPQRDALEAKLRRLAGENPEDAAAALRDLEAGLDVADVYKALRRIQEMQKIFTFIDVYVDANDFLAVRVDGRDLQKLSARDRNAAWLESELRRLLESVRFSDVVLFTFSYGNCRDRTREEAEAAVNGLLNAYRQDASHRGRQFRLGRIGLLRTDEAGPTEDAP
jgi:hypothetical protein